MADLLFDEQIRFVPPGGPDAEWPPVADWTDAEWAHWMRAHNRYDILNQYSDAQIQQYLTIDRYKYGIGFSAPGLGGVKGMPPWAQPDKFVWFYLPTPVAVPFHASKVPNLLFGGAAGGTKSHSARHDALRHCFAIPEFRAILMRRTFEELKRNHLDRIRSEAARMNAFFGKEIVQVVLGDHEVRVDVHGKGRESKIIFGHCQNLGDEEKYLGDAYDGFYPDEMATFEQKQIIGVAGRLRSDKPNIVARMGGTSNPGGAYTLWLKDWFIDKATAKIWAENPRYKPEKYLFIRAMLYDNPYYMDPDGTYTNYEDRLFAYDAERRRQLLLGDWDALTGQFFPEFSRARHVKTLAVPPGCKLERWIDWGYSPHYGICLWVAMLPSGRAYVVYEWKFNGENARQLLVAAQVAQKIKQITIDEVFPLLQVKRITRSLADPSMWAGDGHTGEDYAETFARHGVPLQQADNDRVLGWGRLRHWLREAPDGLPWLIYHPRCETSIRTIPALTRDKSDPDDINTDGEDHPADAARYGVMGRPTPTQLRESAIFVPADSPKGLYRSLTLNTDSARPSGMVS